MARAEKRNMDNYREWARAYRTRPHIREKRRRKDNERRARQKAERIAVLAAEGRCCASCGQQISLEQIARYSRIKFCNDACRQRLA